MKANRSQLANLKRKNNPYDWTRRQTGSINDELLLDELLINIVDKCNPLTATISKDTEINSLIKKGLQLKNSCPINKIPTFPIRETITT